MSSLEDVSLIDETIKIERHIDSVHEEKRPYCSSVDQNIGKVHELINAFKCEVVNIKLEENQILRDT